MVWEQGYKITERSRDRSRNRSLEIVPGINPWNILKIVPGIDPWNVHKIVPGIDPWNILRIVPGIDPWNILEIVSGIDPWNVLKIVLGIDPWNILENASIHSRDRASVQTLQHSCENKKQSSLHKQLIFVAFGVP